MHRRKVFVTIVFIVLFTVCNHVDLLAMFAMYLSSLNTYLFTFYIVEFEIAAESTAPSAF